MERKGGRDYFNWLCDMVDPKHRYWDLCTYLFYREFIYILPMDRNRASDGEYLRVRYMQDYDGDIPNRPCSVLEMMVALSLRCEEQIMEDIDLGSRTHLWFRQMLQSMGLAPYTDGYFDGDRVCVIVDDFLYRRYSPDGHGGLFTTYARGKDMRKLEIWYQAMEHFSEIVFERG